MTSQKPHFKVGVDEAGRGCLAGPIFAAAVVLNPKRPIPELADSKALTPLQRESLEKQIKANALAFAIAYADVKEIDRRGIEWANRIVFTRAVKSLLRASPFLTCGDITVRIDGSRRALRLGLPQELIKGGDRFIDEISAAGILAKTARDRYVVSQMHTRFPQYGFDRHKGYATRQHYDALSKWGPSRVHRLSFNLRGYQEGADHPSA